MLHGIGVPGGIAIARVRHGRDPVHAVTERAVPRSGLPAEAARYRRALALAGRQLRAVRARMPRAGATGVRAFIDSHLMMLRDPVFNDAVIDLSRARACNAEWALILQRDSLLSAFDRIEDPYLRARREEVGLVVERILAALAGTSDDGDDGMDGAICVAHALGPAEVLQLHEAGAAGFVTESGGAHSHAAIIARSLRIPAILGVRDARALVRAEDLAIIDGDSGFVFVSPDERSVAHYRTRRRDADRRRTALRSLRDKPAATRDGLAVELLANIERPGDLRAVRDAGAAGIGMYRTEALFFSRTEQPDEDEQYAAYAKVVDGMRGAPVTIRTVDASPSPGSENPALGLRAIRQGLRDPALLLPQLRALLRAAARGPLMVMVPMVTGSAEVRQVRDLLTQAAVELDDAGIRHAQARLGAMIEVPAAALTAASIARSTDFLAIGTNDLVQYTLAVDRDNDEVDHLYDPLHPAVLKLVALTITAGRRARRPVSLCGEIAGDPRYTRLLVGLGLTRLSMHPAHLLEVKDAVTRMDAEDARKRALRILACRDARRAADLLDEMNRG